MKNALLTVLAGAVALAASTAAEAADVTISLNGVRDAKGPLYVSLQTAAQFLKDEGSYGTIIRAPKPGTLTVVLPNVAPGDYSVSVWHDLDDDKVFDKAESGMPLDGWSMNNAAALRGEPTFDEVKFNVGARGATLNLDMFYAN